MTPSQLRRWATTYGTIDILDVNPSSNTAEHSFHGTGISSFQVLNEESLERPLAEFPPLDKNKQLPSSYAIVPEYALQTKKVSVVACPLDYDKHCCYEQCMAEEYDWLQTAHTLLSTEIKKTDRISWAAYHAAQGRGNPIPETTEVMLPLFHEKAASPAMMKHGLDVLKGITEFLNPGQECVMSMYQPLYADAKYVQWAQPEKYGEKIFVLVMGGLHLEMALWGCVGDLLEGTGWTTVLTEAEVASSCVSNSFLKVSHLARTRMAHEILLLSLFVVMSHAYSNSGTTESFNEWRENLKETSPTFFFWDLVMELEMQVLMFIRSQREGNFQLYVASLEQLVYLFFLSQPPELRSLGTCANSRFEIPSRAHLGRI